MEQRETKRDVYVGKVRKLDEENENFSWHVALSDPLPDDDWDGDTGFIHQVYLKIVTNIIHHLSCEYYLCGPPMMNKAVIDMLQELGLKEKILHLMILVDKLFIRSYISRFFALLIGLVCIYFAYSYNQNSIYKYEGNISWYILDGFIN